MKDTLSIILKISLRVLGGILLTAVSLAVVSYLVVALNEELQSFI